MRITLVSLFAAALLLAACENTPETAANTGGSSTTTAQPPARTGPVPGSKEDFVANVGDRVFFAFDKSDLSADATGRGGSSRLVSVDVTGRNLREVVTPSDASDPAWSPLIP